MKIYVAYSKDGDECTLNNRAFISYDDALKHSREVEQNSGCLLQVIAVELEGKGGMAVMSEQELKQFLHAVAVQKAANTASEEAARKVLQREGVLTSDNKLAEPYAPDLDNDVGC